MLWKGRRESDNVVDQRGSRAGVGKLGGAGLVIGAIVYYMMGGNPLVFLAQNMGSVQSGGNYQDNPEQKSFVGVVLADTEDVWRSVFQSHGKNYEDPQLVLFNGQVESACGSASSAMGPFYCPGDHKVYLDLSFFEELSQSLGAKGDFASAYVIAHEVGHHVQNILGIESEFRQRQSLVNEKVKNQLSVVMELQADCLAGVWAGQTDDKQNIIEPGDIEEAMGAASAVGDDRLQKRSQGRVVPDAFTHGTSEQRVSAFRAGFSSRDLNTCLTTYQAG